jgi:hypothetical protein
MGLASGLRCRLKQGAGKVDEEFRPPCAGARMERRKHIRFRARFDALISTGPAEGAGVLTDLSYAGARMEEASLRPDLGTSVRLYVFVQPVAPFELVGRGTRHTESGFVILYEVSDPEVRRLVDDVSAIVATPQ